MSTIISVKVFSVSQVWTGLTMLYIQRKIFFVQGISRDIELWKAKMLPKLTLFYAQYLVD